MSLAITSTDIEVSKINMAAFELLKSKFPDMSDQDIVRFLFARNQDAEKAEQMLSEHLVWRAGNMPILKSSCLNEFQKGKLYMRGYDKEGHPLLIWHSSKHEAADRDMAEMLRLITWWFQYMDVNLPADKSKITLLCDRSDYKSSNSDVEFVKAASAVLQNNFPERLHRAVIYPTGLVFYGLWNVIKWFLDPVTQAKAAPVIYQSGVQSYIDPEHIPKHMGGESEYEFDPAHFEDPPGLEEDKKVSTTENEGGASTTA